jgi:hypothetical protein
MRSYTNRDGDSITVSEEHLTTAVKIKQELQKASPSRKCSWQTLVKLMEKEGFFDSENSEAYRCMIKSYQKSIGELPEAPTYANMVADGKLASIKELVGEIAYEKRESQHVLRQLNKVKRDVIDYTLLAEQIGIAFDKHDFSKLRLKYIPNRKTSKKKAIVNLSDIHVGALVDNEYNKYNYEIAIRRMQEYLGKVLDICRREGIKDVYVMNLGDVIENPYMHNLAYSCEFNLQDQILYAGDLIIKFLVGLSEGLGKDAIVRTAGIGGNHDRLNASKNDALDGDHAVKSVNFAIKKFLENAKIKTIIYEQAQDYSHTIEINGIFVKFVHGDKDNIKDENLLAKHCNLDGIHYTLIIMGHYHHFRAIEQGFGRYVVSFNSLKGADNHSVNQYRKSSSVGQGMVIVDENGEYDIIPIRIA